MAIYKASAFAQSELATYQWYTFSATQPLNDYVVGVTGAADTSELGFPTIGLLLGGESGDMWERVTVEGVSCLRPRRVVGVDKLWRNENSSLGRALVPYYSANESPLWSSADGAWSPKE